MESATGQATTDAAMDQAPTLAEAWAWGEEFITTVRTLEEVSCTTGTAGTEDTSGIMAIVAFDFLSLFTNTTLSYAKYILNY